MDGDVAFHKLRLLSIITLCNPQYFGILSENVSQYKKEEKKKF